MKRLRLDVPSRSELGCLLDVALAVVTLFIFCLLLYIALG